jgi:hypothetical protein
MVLDPDTPFLELCLFAGYQQPGSSPSASVIAGVGIVKYVPLQPPLISQRNQVYDNFFHTNYRRRFFQCLLCP